MSFFYIPPGGGGSGGSGGVTEDQVKLLIHHRTTFNNVAVVNVVHNLGRHPSVTVTDTAGTEYEADVEHLSDNQLTVTFGGAMSGFVYCN